MSEPTDHRTLPPLTGAGTDHEQADLVETEDDLAEIEDEPSDPQA